MPWSMWPAVPMTTVIRRPPVATAWCQGTHERLAQRRVVHRVDRAQVEQDRSVLDPRHDGRVAGPQPASQSIGRAPDHDQPDRLERLAGQRPATDRRLHLGHRPGNGPRDRPRQQRVGPRAERPRVAAIIRQTGISVVGPTGAIEPQGRRQRGEDDLLRSDRAGERVLPDPGDEVRAPDDQPGLRPADQLVAAERHDVRAGRQPLARRRLVGQPEGAPSRAARRCRDRR